MDAPGLPLSGAGEVDFQALYSQMLKLVAGASEVKDASGNLKFTDLCEFLAAEFPDTTHRDQFAKDLQELEQSCCAILGHEVVADHPARNVPAPPPPASTRAAGYTLCQYRLRLWDFGFVEEAAIRGAWPKSDWCWQATAWPVSSLVPHVMPAFRHFARCSQHMRRDQHPGKEHQGRGKPD